MIVWSKYNIYLYDNVLIQPSTVCNEYRKKGREGGGRLILIREEFFIPIRGKVQTSERGKDWWQCFVNGKKRVDAVCEMV